jgi:hypothetical protein
MNISVANILSLGESVAHGCFERSRVGLFPVIFILSPEHHRVLISLNGKTMMFSISVSGKCRTSAFVFILKFAFTGVL